MLYEVITHNLKYTCLSNEEQVSFNTSLADIFNTQFADYLYNESGLYEKGKNISNLEFADLIAQETLTFAYLHKSDVFLHPLKAYKRPESYECGNISLLVNGNSFLLRDYMITANRKVRIV